MKLDTFGLNIVKKKEGSVETLTLFQDGVFTLKCFFYDWGVKRFVPPVNGALIAPANGVFPALYAIADPHMVSMLDYKGANRLSDQDKIKLMMNTSRRFLKRVDLSFDYKFMFEMDLSDEETKQLWNPTAEVEAPDALED